MMRNRISKVNFKNFITSEYQNCTPVLIVFSDVLYKIDSWHEAMKLFLYNAYKNDSAREYIDELALTHHNIPKIRNNLSMMDSPIKFSERLYYNVITDKRITSRTPTYAAENLTTIKLILNHSDFCKFELYLVAKEDTPELDAKVNSIIEKLTNRESAIRRTKKSAKYTIAKINDEIFSPLEKLNSKIAKPFREKILLGDIPLSDDDVILMRSYMSSEIKRLNGHTSIGRFSPHYPRLFALELVRFAMKHYNQKRFWPYFEEEYGVSVNITKQNDLHWAFRCILQQNNKLYDDSIHMKIDNISMHSFVTDQCAPQFFDYLFDFWRIDLCRNIDNMSGKNNPYFEILMEELMQVSQNMADVMAHTSLAIKSAKKSCSLRIRRILNLIDACYWDNAEISHTNNRINALLQAWMNDNKGKWKKERKSRSGVRSKKYLSSPTLCLNKNGTFSIELPRQILKDCIDNEYICWEIRIPGEPAIHIDSEPAGKVVFQTNKRSYLLQIEHLFDKISLTLLSDRKKYAHFTIKADEYRFFDEKYGELVIYENDYIADGSYLCYSKLTEFPSVLYQEAPEYNSDSFVNVCQLDLNRGDILCFPDKNALLVGERIQDGLIGASPLSDIYADDQSHTPVFIVVPKIMFKTTRKQLTGTALSIATNKENRWLKMADLDYKEFRLHDMLDNVYAYILDLSEFICEEGRYKIFLDIPDGKFSYRYEFLFLKYFHPHFLDFPYVFTKWGKISFDTNDRVKEIKGDWKNTAKEKTFSFNFDQTDKDCSCYVKDSSLLLPYCLNGEEVPLVFEIPSFYWKLNENDEWNSNLPAELFLKRLPSRLFVKGPFSFGEKTYLELEAPALEDEVRLFAEKSSTNARSFPLSRLKSYLNYNMEEADLSIVLDGIKHPLCKIICKSKVLSCSLYGDFARNLLRGKIDIQGDEEYSVVIKRDDEVFAELPLQNGMFEVFTPLEEGSYNVEIYELEDDEDGFGNVASFLIAHYQVELINQYNLSNKKIKILSIQDHAKKYAPLELLEEYVIDDLRCIDYNMVADSIVGIWRKVDTKQCSSYQGILFAIDNKRISKKFEVLLVFCDRENLTSPIILRKINNEYCELLYNAFSRTLIFDDTEGGENRYERIQNIRLLSDDTYDLQIEIKR